MNEFKAYHPAVSLVFFCFIIVFSVLLMHPVCLLFSFLGAFMYCVIIGTGKVKNFLYILPLAIGAAVLNPLLNHEGATVLTYFKNGNPLTAESIYFGIAAAVMLLNVICWFSCFNSVMTSDKIIYLFGKTLPSISLMLSIILRFIPRFTQRLKDALAVQKSMGKTGKSILERFRRSVSALSATVTWSLENAIEISDSMTSRGYGLKGRTSFAVYIFTKRDIKVLFIVLLLGIYIIFGAFAGGMKYRYFPTVSGVEVSTYSVSVFAAYFILCMIPVIIEIMEVCRWKAIKSKI
jgi:energy-coupling factor transport system permease protein